MKVSRGLIDKKLIINVVLSRNLAVMRNPPKGRRSLSMTADVVGKKAQISGEFGPLAI